MTQPCINKCSVKLTVSQNDELMTEAIQRNADIGPKGIVRRKFMKAEQQQRNIGHMAQQAKMLSDKPRKKQVKQDMVSLQHPETQMRQ